MRRKNETTVNENLPKPTFPTSEQQPAPAPQATIVKAKRPWYQKKRFIIPIGTLVAIIVISSVASGGGGDEDTASAGAVTSQSDTEATTEEEVVEEEPAEPEPEPIEVPDVLGMSPKKAKKVITEAGLVFESDYIHKGDGVEAIDVDSGWGDVYEGDTVTVTFDWVLTLAQSNAVGKAESYLDYTAFSRTGLIDQLEYEGFSTEEATFAVDHVTVSWKEQAALKAQSYLDYTSFSRQGLYDQLAYEGFTADQINYGLQAVGY